MFAMNKFIHQMVLINVYLVWSFNGPGFGSVLGRVRFFEAYRRADFGSLLANQGRSQKWAMGML